MLLVTEDQLLNIVAVEQLLARLEEPDRLMLRMIYHLDHPDDYEGPWPATYTDIGVYVGTRYEGQPLSEAAIRYRRDVLLAVLRGERGPLRRNAAGNPKNPRESSLAAEERARTRRKS